MPEEVHVAHTAPRVAPAAVQRVSWGAIFAGVFVTLVSQILFTLLGTAIGAATINPMSESNPARGLGLGAGIWLLVTGLISVWVGALVAGRLAGGPRRADGLIHGVVTWSVATLAMFVLLTTATGALLGGTGSLLGKALSSQGGQGQGAMASVQNQVRQALPQADAILPPTGRTDNQQQQAAAQASQQARQAGERAAEGVAQGALWGFIALLLGLLAAAWGGWLGTASLPRTGQALTASTATTS